MAGTLNIAHRGASSLAPENTMISFQKAYEAGADGLEFDVQMSSDGIPVVIHDEKIDRTTNGQGLIKDYSLDELRNLDAGSWYDPEFSGAKIPTLDEVLDQFLESNLIFNIELKSGIVLYPGLEGAVLKSVASRSLEQRVIISSFNHYSLVECRKINPDIRTGILYVAGLYEPWNYARSLGCYSVHPLFYHLQHPEIVTGFRENKLPIFAWTVNEINYMELMVAGGIEAIITDRPQELKKILDGGK
ncbi:MAG: glycerophosphodiester phosphodiesterase [Bacillota bacterium]|nr:glycerophosphodiester phosphodiesterase [Bacillota bacterium]